MNIENLSEILCVLVSCIYYYDSVIAFIIYITLYYCIY